MCHNLVPASAAPAAAWCSCPLVCHWIALCAVPGAQHGLCSQVDGDTTMLARDVLPLVREALGRELMSAEVHAVHT